MNEYILHVYSSLYAQEVTVLMDRFYSTGVYGYILCALQKREETSQICVNQIAHYDKH
jgi:hypothetical protein